LLPRGEQRALIVLSFVLLFSLLIRIGVQFLPGREPAGFQEFEKEYRALMSAVARSDSMAEAASRSKRDADTRHPSPLTGRSPVYWQRRSNRSPPPLQQTPIHINSADSAQLLPLPGIGPVFAGRIIKYRDLLGGFVRVEQLGEVYGLSQETLELIRDHIHIDTSSIQRITISSASFGDLLRHPYLGLEEVKALVEYRDFAGVISSMRELQENCIWPDSTLQRICPYLEFR
jgi:competence ComEA-like helix-hairpin-helix protein